jgi:hypothetical protein
MCQCLPTGVALTIQLLVFISVLVARDDFGGVVADSAGCIFVDFTVSGDDDKGLADEDFVMVPSRDHSGFETDLFGHGLDEPQ